MQATVYRGAGTLLHHATFCNSQKRSWGGVNMFFDSVAKGAQVFTFWETWVLIVLYIAAVMGAVLLGGALISRGRRILGLLWMIFGAPTVQVSMSFIVLTILSPIIFGSSSDASWSLPLAMLQAVPLSTGKLLLVALIISFILSAFMGATLPGVVEFAVGGTILAFLSKIIVKVAPVFEGAQIEVWPGFLMAAGFVAVAGALKLVATFTLALAVSVAKIDPEENSESMAAIAASIQFALAFLPTFMYGGYLALQFQRFL